MKKSYPPKLPLFVLVWTLAYLFLMYVLLGKDLDSDFLELLLLFGYGLITIPISLIFSKLGYRKLKKYLFFIPFSAYFLLFLSGWFYYRYSEGVLFTLSSGFRLPFALIISAVFASIPSAVSFLLGKIILTFMKKS